MLGKETCPKTKKTHYQGWIQFENKKRFGGVKKILGTNKIHLETCRGSEHQNDQYCQKDGDFWTLGKFVCQGQRSDIEHVRKEILGGKSRDAVIKDNTKIWCQYRKGLGDLLEIVTKENSQNFRKVEVEYVYGPTGTGKTRYAASHPNSYKIEGDNMQWFDGYNGEKTLIIDEYSNDVKITKLLNICDGYQLRLPIKGGFTYAAWTKVIITSNLYPDELHEMAKRRHRDALKRRITKTIAMCQSGPR